MLEGIDVSHYQGDVDWSKVKSAGKEFAFAKATEGTSYVDPQYSTNRAGALSAGLVFGAYHFFDPDADAKAQAEHYLQASGIGKGMMHAALDLETAPSAAGYADRVAEWISVVTDATGMAPILYSNPSFWNSYLGSFDRYVLWLADYAPQPSLPTGISQWVFWQYSQNGSVDGIEGAVDLDHFNGDMQQLDGFVLK